MLPMPIIKFLGQIWSMNLSHCPSAPFQELKMDVSPSCTRTNHEYDDSIIYIYIYININTKYNTIYINTISQPSKNNIKQQSSKPPSDFRWCYFTLKESPTRHFLNVLQALTEPTHPHLPLRTLEVLVDEVLFLEHLSKIFPCKTQESYIGFGGF